MGIKELLQKATNDILSEEVLGEIETAFANAVQDKLKIHVEKALVEQDNDYANKLKHLLEVVDKDHTKKLLKVVEAIDVNHSAKLKKIVEKYNREINQGAKGFKDNIVNNVSTYLEAYLDEAIPAEKLLESVNSRKAKIVLEQIRNILGVDAAVAKNSIRTAIMDGKRQIDEAHNKLEVVTKELSQYKQQYGFAKAQLVLEKKLDSVQGKKKDYLKKIMKGKSSDFILENFDYASNLFDKSETDRLQNLKEEAISSSTSQRVDRPVIEERVIIEEDVNDFNETAIMSPYLQELSKF